MSVRVTGLTETIGKLKKFAVEAERLKTALTKVGKLFTSEAKKIVPRKTGRLAGSIEADASNDRVIMRAGSGTVVYAKVIHNGGYHGIKPHPFLKTAVVRSQGQAVDLLEQEFDNLINNLT